ncbi:Protein KTI13 [Nakaseomyces bracarensis]|uniref:Protein KTI13 n=1 Tax=Nakaseomyces bracarensis TaxID=273131 RepID=A0ABR4NX13_9SACH
MCTVLGQTEIINLGLNHDEDTLAPLLSYKGDEQLKVKRINCGGNHTLMLLSDGTLLGCGDNSSGQLESNSNKLKLIGWQQLKVPGKVVDCAACWDSTIIVTEEGLVYSRGNGMRGELGLGESCLEVKDDFKMVIDVSNFRNVRLFSSFQNCILVVDQIDGSSSIVYGWGNNTKCQLFEPKSRRVSNPQVILENVLISDVSMGKDWLVLIDTNGKIVKFQGNIPVEFANIYDDKWRDRGDLEIRSMWKSIHIRPRTTSSVYSYGNNIHGQLFPGIGDSAINELERFSTGSEHGIIYCKMKGSNNEVHTVFCWGWGEHGNCGSIEKKRQDQWINDKSNLSSPLNPIVTLTGRGVHTSIDLYGGCATTWIVSNTPIM